MTFKIKILGFLSSALCVLHMLWGQKRHVLFHLKRSGLTYCLCTLLGGSMEETGEPKADHPVLMEAHRELLPFAAIMEEQSSVSWGWIGDTMVNDGLLGVGCSPTPLKWMPGQKVMWCQVSL